MIIGIDQFPVNNALCKLNIRGIADTDDHSPSGHSVSNTGVLIETPQNLGHDSMKYEQSNGDHLSIVASVDWDIVGTWAVGFWVKMTKVPNNYSQIVKHNETGSPWHGWNISYENRNTNIGDAWYNKVALNISDGSTTRVVSRIDIADDIWHYITLAREFSVLYLFVDGVVAGTLSYAVPAVAGLLYIGSNAGTAGFLNGSLQNLQFFKNYNPFGTRGFTPMNRVA